MTKELPISRELDASSLERSCKVGGLAPGSRIHVSGACGTGMAAVLTLLKSLGFHVSGSDKAFYPPMGDIVRKTADKVFEGYDGKNLEPHPDLVVIGNSLSRNNPEVEYVLANNLPFASMPEVFSGLLIGTREHCPTSIVITGTHGKSTTSAACAVLFDTAGRKPGYFVGGIPKNLPGGIRAVDTSIPKEQRVVVLEGDEYDSAFFAKYAKFHSYRPDIAVVTSIEFDHADIYNSVEEIEAEFTKLAARVPQKGLILVADTGERLEKLVPEWKRDPAIRAAIKLYGEKPSSDFQLISRKPDPSGGQELELRLEHLRVSCRTPLSGPHNAWNLLAVAACGYTCGLTPEEIGRGIAAFEGVLRRQQVIFNTAGITVIEDFAHHPTAVDLTLKGISESYPGRRVIAVFEPRSNTSRRGFFQAEYASSFSSASRVLLLEVKDAGGYTGTSSPIIPLDVPKLAAEISKAGTEAKSAASVDEIINTILGEIRAGDVIVLMSNGDFGGLPAKLPRAINEKVSHGSQQKS